MNTIIFWMVIIFADASPPIVTEHVTNEACTEALLEASRIVEKLVAKGYCLPVNNKVLGVEV